MSFPEINRRRRGHQFAPTAPQRAALLPIGAGDNIPAAAKIVGAHWFVGRCDWWITECDAASGEAFGYTCLGDPQLAEWGSIDLAEVEALIIRGIFVVERDLHWTPRPFGEVHHGCVARMEG